MHCFGHVIQNAVFRKERFGLRVYQRFRSITITFACARLINNNNNNNNNNNINKSLYRAYTNCPKRLTIHKLDKI